MTYKRDYKTEIRAALRRLAAKIMSEYPAPALAHVDDLFSDLDAAADLGPAGSEWASFTAQIRDALRQSGANEFLRLPPIAKTLHSRQRSAAQRYLTYLCNSPRFSPAMQNAITESPVGMPLVNPFYPFSSPLLVQHGYHLVRLLEATNCDIATLGLIVEFGGGYGSFYRLLRNLGYRESYIICDLPVMCALQRFYLRNLFPNGPDARTPSNLRWLSGEMQNELHAAAAQHSPSLFVATWSLSETPLAIRSRIAAAIAGFDYVLIAYQRVFGTCDNVEYFASLEKALPQYTWQHAECPAYRNNFYLIGQNTARSGEQAN